MALSCGHVSKRCLSLNCPRKTGALSLKAYRWELKEKTRESSRNGSCANTRRCHRIYLLPCQNAHTPEILSSVAVCHTRYVNQFLGLAACYFSCYNLLRVFRCVIKNRALRGEGKSLNDPLAFSLNSNYICHFRCRREPWKKEGDE